MLATGAVIVHALPRVRPRPGTLPKVIAESFPIHNKNNAQ